MVKKCSVIIPTLQKNINILGKLVTLLDNDKSVEEIIIIDNTGKDFDEKFYSLSSKIKTIINNKNEYVNPCWNKGVKISRNEYFALFNDDVIISNNFCLNVLKNFKSNTGLIGISKDVVVNVSPNACNNIKFDNKKPKIKQSKIRNEFYGIVMFGRKQDYFKIPKDMKVWCGDDYLFYMNKKNGRKNYKITNCQIYHMHSLTSSLPIFDEIKQNDVEIMKRYFSDWYIDKHLENNNINSFFETIFSVRNNNKHKLITILGIKFKIKSPKLIERQRINEIQNQLKEYESRLYDLEIKYDNLVKQIELKQGLEKCN